MINKSVIIITIMLLIVLISYLKNKKKKNKYDKNAKGCEVDNSYDKVEVITIINFIQCENCLESSNDYCTNCNASQQYISEEHCHEHNHSHHHHKHHSRLTSNTQGYLLLLLLFAPLIVGAAAYRVIKLRK